MKIELHEDWVARHLTPRSRGSNRGIALVITLLMLSVITFLAIAFLAMTQRDQSAVTTTVDVNNAQLMGDAALARAQSEIIAQMMTHGDLLSYDYMASHNYISPAGFNNSDPVYPDPQNVNYDHVSSGVAAGKELTLWNEHNIGNLLYDPRVPVYVTTNPAVYPSSNDFRFWVDVNQNGHFETNGYVTNYDRFGNPILDANGNAVQFFNGEPEWIGVLRDPLNPHSSTNPFIGRYAYMVLPIGKTEDANFIHNYSKQVGYNQVEALPYEPLAASVLDGSSYDGFIRDQGVGSWELNLAALLVQLNTNIYQNTPDPYDYVVPLTPPSQGGETTPNQGLAFEDAWSMIYYRYLYPGGNLPADLANNFNPNNINSDPPLPNFNLNGIDEYGYLGASGSNQFYSSMVTDPNYRKKFKTIQYSWPGSYNTNMYYDVEDLLNSNKTSSRFVTRLVDAMTTNSDSYDRNTFQRLLASIGTGSSPEYGVYVYSNGFTFLSNNIVTYMTNQNVGLINSNGVTTLSNLVAGITTPDVGTPIANTLPTWLRTKVNLNYDNTPQLVGGPYTPASTNLTNWAPITFFTNAADLLLRSQEFPVTNFNGITVAYNHFGITNIPIYNSVIPGIQYTAQIHRMLQLAANIYDDINATNWQASGYGTNILYPHIYRPLFSATNIGSVGLVYITGYQQMGPAEIKNWCVNGGIQPINGFRNINDITGIASDSRTTAGANIWGIPWIVAAAKGFPTFNRFSMAESFAMTRDLIFYKIDPTTAGKPNYTNEFYQMALTNVSGLDAWNSSALTFKIPLRIVASNLLTITITNNGIGAAGYGYTTNFTNVFPGSGYITTNNWVGKTFLPMFQNTTTPLPLGYYSTVLHTYTNMSSISNEETFVSLGKQEAELEQTTYPEYDWSMIISNKVFYWVCDNNYNVLDFVNIGPVVVSNNLTAQIITNVSPKGVGGQQPGAKYWNIGTPTGVPTVLAPGALQQIVDAETGDSTFAAVLNGQTKPPTNWYGPGNLYPTVYITNKYEWVANDPLVHYTPDDLSWPGSGISTPVPAFSPNAYFLAGDNVGLQSTRYQPWGSGTVPPGVDRNLLRSSYQDALITSSDAWVFPTNEFPSVGWLGRVHRGTPWQTVYMKSGTPSLGGWNDWVTAPIDTRNAISETNPTNDWRLFDLFTAAPNDNALRGALSVNQTNDAAWAAVFGGVIALTNGTGGFPINPTNDINYMMDSNGVGINLLRSNVLGTQALLHHVGEILAAPSLTVDSPAATSPTWADGVPDYVSEAIPQQTLGLLKVGYPQFVIYSWGQALRPRNVDLGAAQSMDQGLCTNYEITGEYETRTVCHVVGDPAAQNPKFVVDSFNIVPSN